MRNYFTFGSIDSRTYGVYISGTGVFNAPDKEYDFISIPGRNGDLVGNLKRLSNIELTYPAFCYKNFQTNIRSLHSALLAVDGYAKLRDSYYSNEYRKAVYTGGSDTKPVDRLNAANFDLTFNCKPQRYLDSGDTVIVLNGTGSDADFSISNPTEFASSPLIRVYGYGDVTVCGITATIVNVYPYIDIDCDIMDCFYGTTNANAQVTFTGNNFPTIPPGAGAISIPGTVTKIELTPRWWRV